MDKKQNTFLPLFSLTDIQFKLNWAPLFDIFI